MKILWQVSRIMPQEIHLPKSHKQPVEPTALVVGRKNHQPTALVVGRKNHQPTALVVGRKNHQPTALVVGRRTRWKRLS
jgi:hypothetical protein